MQLPELLPRADLHSPAAWRWQVCNARDARKEINNHQASSSIINLPQAAHLKVGPDHERLRSAAICPEGFAGSAEPGALGASMATVPKSCELFIGCVYLHVHCSLEMVNWMCEMVNWMNVSISGSKRKHTC